MYVVATPGTSTVGGASSSTSSNGASSDPTESGASDSTSSGAASQSSGDQVFAKQTHTLRLTIHLLWSQIIPENVV